MRYRRFYPPRSSSVAVFWLALVTAFGCGSVSYKPGGTDSDYHAAGERCHKQGRAESPELERCMEEQGWVVKQLGAPAAPSDAKKSVPAASPSSGLQPPPPAGDAAPPAKVSHGPSVKEPTVVKTEQPSVVNGWFKLGGTADALAAAKARCATKLGAVDRPDTQSQAVTGEMVDCLRNEGWRAF